MDSDDPSPPRGVQRRGALHATADISARAGTIVTGAAANKAKAAALAAYPGGTVNRVVLLSNGEYNVHMIAVNWPHHVFVSTNFKVLGAE